MINDPGVRGLDVQPLPGDVARPALPATAPCRRPASPRADFAATRPGFDFTPREHPGQHLHRRPDLRGQPGRRAGHAGSTRSGSQDGVYQLPGNTGVLRRRRRLGHRRIAGVGALADRLRLRQPRQAGLRRGGHRRPGDRLLRLRHRQGRRRRLLHGRLRRLRRQRRLAAGRRRLRLHRRARTTTSGRTPRRWSTTTPTRSPACPASPPTTSSRTSRAGRSGTPTTPTPTMTTDRHRRRAQGVRPGRPVQRQPRDRDRQGERDLPRVRPLARPARLLLHRQPRDLRRLEPDGDRQVAEHGRLLAARSSAGSCREVLEPGSTHDGRRAGRTPSEDTGAITWQTPGRHAVHPDRRRRRPRAELRGVRREAAGPAAARPGRSSTPATRPARRTPGGRSSGNDFGCAPTGGPQPRPRDPRARRRADPGSDGDAGASSRCWDIEWDFDYGYVLTTTDGGETYTSHASENGYTTSNTDPLAGNPNANACQADVRQRHHRHQRLVRRRHRGRPTARPSDYPDAGVPRRQLRHQRPGRRAERRAAVQLRHRPGPRPAGLVHRRRQGHRDRARRGSRASCWSPTSRPAAVRTTTRVFNGGCRERPEHRAAVHARLDVRRGRRRGAGRPRLLPRAARPLRLRPRRPGPDRPRPDRVRRRAVSSSTPTRRTATATPAYRRPAGAVAARLHARARATRRPTSTTPRSPRRPAGRRTPTRGEGHTDNYTDPAAQVDPRTPASNPWQFRLRLPGLPGHVDDRHRPTGRTPPTATSPATCRSTWATAAVRSTTATSAVEPGAEHRARPRPPRRRRRRCGPARRSSCRRRRLRRRRDTGRPRLQLGLRQRRHHARTRSAQVVTTSYGQPGTKHVTAHRDRPARADRHRHAWTSRWPQRPASNRHVNCQSGAVDRTRQLAHRPRRPAPTTATTATTSARAAARTERRTPSRARASSCCTVGPSGAAR